MVRTLNGDPHVKDVKAFDYLPDGNPVAFDVEGAELILKTTELETAEDVHDLVQGAVPVDDDAEDLESEAEQEAPDAEALGLVSPSGPPSHLAPLREWHAAMFGSESNMVYTVAKGVDAYNKLAHSGTSTRLRPGHTPPGGVCPRCGETLPKSKHRQANVLHATHAHRCEAEHAVSLAAPALLQRYPSQDIEYLEPSGPGSNRFKTRKATVYHILKSVGKRRRTIRCVCSQEFASHKLYREHLLLEHDFYLPHTASAVAMKQLLKDVARGKWDRDVARFEAVYYHSDELYHVDPKEQQLYGCCLCCHCCSRCRFL